MRYQWILTGVCLIICTCTDVRSRIISRKVLGSYLILVLVGRCAEGIIGLKGLLSGGLPGLFCLFLSWITREGLGLGDSLLILVCGMALGWSACMELTFFAFLLAGLWGMISLCRKRGGRKESFPFVPFLTAGFLVQSLISCRWAA